LDGEFHKKKDKPGKRSFARIKIKILKFIRLLLAPLFAIFRKPLLPERKILLRKKGFKSKKYRFVCREPGKWVNSI